MEIDVLVRGLPLPRPRPRLIGGESVPRLSCIDKRFEVCCNPEQEAMNKI